MIEERFSSILKPLPDKKYNVIYTDPPWQHNSKQMSGGTGPKDYYSTIPTNDMCLLPIENVAADDCILFMWAVSPMLIDAIVVGKSWGFHYTTVGFVWDKQAVCPGYYTMSQCELCLIFKRGKIPKPMGERNIRQFLSVKRGSHSVKPDHVRERIKKIFPTQPKIELFAREQYEGWDAWGNEV